MIKFNRIYGFISCLLVIFTISLISISTEARALEGSALAPIHNTNSEDIPKSLIPKLIETFGASNSDYYISKDKNIYKTTTPGHGITTSFHKDRVVFERGQNSIGMSLVTNNNSPISQIASKNKVEYIRGNLVEWYVNSPYGIEQGFTLNKKPDLSSNVTITLGFDMSNGVKAIYNENGKSIKFVDSNNNHILNYDGLYAFDSTGSELKSYLNLNQNNSIEIVVDDKNAKYPITIDPFIQSQRVTASDPSSGSGDDFGFSVSIDGDRAIVGIPSWDDAAGNGQGAAIIYERDGSGVWVEFQTLLSPEANGFDDFGTSVSISGDWALVGEPDGDDSFSGDGSAHFFQRVAGVWTFRQTVSHTTNNLAEAFGITVSILGDRAIVGDPLYGTGATNNNGAVFVYERTGTTWNAVSGNPIFTMDNERNDQFGTSVSISGDWFISGAPGDSNNGGFSDTIVWGAVYFFQRDGSGNWTEIQKVIGVADSDLGESVHIDGSIAVAGSPGEVVTGFGANTGAAYIFERSGTTWGNTTLNDNTDDTRIQASNPNGSDDFGVSVSVSADYVAIGSTGQDIGEPAQPGTISNAGAVYIYKRASLGNWGDEQEVLASDPTTSAIFGQSVSISGNTILVGSPQADEGTDPDPIVAEQGAAYFLDLAAMLTIEKESNPDAGTGFEFGGTGFTSDCGLDGTFTLDDNDSAGTSFIDCDVLPGSYTVQETNPNGHVISDINCLGTVDFTEDADSVTVNLVSDDMVVCTFTNTVQHTLTITPGGTGSGTVTSSPAGINCGGDCTKDYNDGTVITLSNTPDAGSVFVEYTGAGCTTGVVTLNGDTTCVAVFDLIPQRTLDVSINGTGSGTVTSNPVGIDCEGDCTEVYDDGTVITLSNTPDANSVFVEYTGTGCETGTVTMDANRNCAATFDLKPELTIEKDGTGTGSVTTAPAGIDCGDTCSAQFDPATVVTMNAAPAPGSMFVGFTGAGCTSGSVTLNSDTTCTATFTLIPEFDLSISKDGTGGGTVTSGPAGINCGAACTASFTENTVVTLTPLANIDSEFVGWSGDADCSDGIVTMSDARNCTATFDLVFVAPTITLLPLDPAQGGVLNTYTVTGATPNGPVQILWGFNEGDFSADTICRAFIAGIINPRVLTTVTANGSGTAVFSQNLPNNIVGITFKIQAVDITTCEGSNVTTETIDPSDPQDAPVLNELQPGSVGPNTLTSTNHTPGSLVGFIWGFTEEPTNANYLCPGLQVGIKNFRDLTIEVADQLGNVTINVDVPQNFVGVTVKLQTIDLISCTSSNVNTETF